MLYWLTALASLVGVWLNIRRRVASFYVWAVTNAVWAGVDLAHGIYPQAALQAVYFAMSLWGIARWSRRSDPRTGRQAGVKAPDR